MNNSLVFILPAFFNKAVHDIDFLETLTAVAKKKRLKKIDLVYIDGYSLYFLISLILYFLLNRNITKLVIWIRYPYSNFVKKCIFNFFIYVFNKDLNNQLLPITKNTYLARILSKRFAIKV